MIYLIFVISPPWNAKGTQVTFCSKMFEILNSSSAAKKIGIKVCFNFGGDDNITTYLGRF